MIRIKLIVGASLLIFLTILLTSCASKDLKTPCPDFGKYCEKTLVNSWDYSKV